MQRKTRPRLDSVGVLPGIKSLWQDKLLLDYTIEVEDEQFKVHKVVMASVSDYFKAMLTGGMVESQTDRVRLEGLSCLAVQTVIEFIYTGHFGSSKISAEECLACAMYLQIPSAIKACTVSLCEEVNTDNCFHILSIFKVHANKDGIEHTLKFIKLNMEIILKDCDQNELTYEEFVNLMELWERSEWELFTAVREWLNADNEKRKQHVNDLMSHVRFCLMSPADIAAIKNLYSDNVGSWHELVEKADIYHNLPTHQKVLNESEQCRVRSEPTPVCFRVQPTFRGQLFAMDNKKSWIYRKADNPPMFHRLIKSDPLLVFCEANNFLIVCDDNGQEANHFYIFDPRTMTWSAMASPNIPRCSCALVYHDRHVYVLGGCDKGDKESHLATDIIEKFDFQTNSWSIVDSKMPVLLIEHSAFSIGSCIYVTEGLVTEETVLYHDWRLHCFEPETGKWYEKNVASLNELRSRVVAVEILGERVLAGVDKSFKLHYYKPSIDQWMVYDFTAPSKLEWCKFSRLLAKGNTIFFLNYIRDKEVESADVEEFSGACEKWTLGEDVPRIDILSEYPSLSEESDDPIFDPVDNFCALLSHSIRR